MTHQVLEEYNSLPTTQTTDRVPHKTIEIVYKVHTKGDCSERRKLFDSKF